MASNMAQIVVRTLNDESDSGTYDLDYEVARAITFAASLSGRPHGYPSPLDIEEAIAAAFAIDDLVLVGTLHMLSQIDVYTAALRGDEDVASG